MFFCQQYSAVFFFLLAPVAQPASFPGACEGSLACSTCHVIVEDPELYSRLPEPDDDENDMLDLAFGLTDTCVGWVGAALATRDARLGAHAGFPRPRRSRLGCQIKTTKELDGLVVRIPSATRNFAVDGFVPKPH